MVHATKTSRQQIMIKGKDFKKAVVFIKEFLLKLPDDVECAELRDSLNLSLLHMKTYFKTVWLQSQDKDDSLLSSSVPRGLSPVTPNQDSPETFYWKWIDVDNSKVVRASLPLDGKVSRLPLMLQAVKEDDHQLIENLLQKEPSNAQDLDEVGRTALMYATYFNRLECLSKLLSCSTDVNYKAHDGSTAVHVAVHNGNYKALDLLIQHGACVNIQDSHGRVPLHWAAAISQAHCLELLLKCEDINVNSHDVENLTPAMWACHMDHKQHFELLISSENNHIEENDGIERDGAGKTWIHWAVRKEPPLQCLTSLMSSGTLAMQDAEGKTVIHTASEKGALEACRIIIDQGGDSCLQAVDFQHRTCLHLAAMAAHGEVVNFLLEKGADVSAKDKFNATAWDYAYNRDLHYCKLIIRSFEKHLERKDKRNKLPSHQNMEESRETNENHTEQSKNTSVSPTPPNQPRPKIQSLQIQSRGSHKRGVPIPHEGSSAGNLKGKEDGPQMADAMHIKEDSVISSEMQPSDQTVAILAEEHSCDESPREESQEDTKRQMHLASVSSVSSDSSEHSINISMNVSDCDEDEIEIIEGRDASSTEPFPMTVKSPIARSIPSSNPDHQALPRPCSPAPSNKPLLQHPLPLPPPVLSMNALTPGVSPRPLTASTSPRLFPLGNIPKDKQIDAKKNKKKKKKKTSKGDRGGAAVKPLSTSPTQFAQRSPQQPHNVLSSSQSNSKIPLGHSSSGRLSPSRDLQQLSGNESDAQARSSGTAWEVAWQPRYPLSPTQPHSPRQKQQRMPHSPRTNPLASIHQLPNANGNRQIHSPSKNDHSFKHQPASSSQHKQSRLQLRATIPEPHQHPEDSF